MLKQSFKAIEPQRMSSEVAPSQSLPTVKETVSGSLSVSVRQFCPLVCRFRAPLF